MLRCIDVINHEPSESEDGFIHLKENPQRTNILLRSLGQWMNEMIVMWRQRNWLSYQYLWDVVFKRMFHKKLTRSVVE